MAATRYTGTRNGDRLSARTSGDTLEGLAGNDILNSGTTSLSGVWLYGGDGNDTLIAKTVDALIDGGAGIDTAQFSTAVAAADLTDAKLVGVEKVLLVNTSSAGYDFSAQREGLDITGTRVTDDITGGSGNDTITGGLGADTLRGGDGDDVLAAEATDALISGGAGADTVRFAAAVARSSGGVAQLLDADLVDADNRINIVITHTGNAVYDFADQSELLNITGGRGKDTITGGQAADTLSGGNGNDLLIASVNDALIDGGAGNDTVRYGANADISALDDAELLNVEYVVITDLDGGSYDFSSQTEGLDITATGSADTLKGGSGVDVLRGGMGDDRLYAGDNDRLIDGGNGIDTAYFAIGVSARSLMDTDLINVECVTIEGAGAYDFSVQSEKLIISAAGATGAVTLTGGKGVDTLTGGAGDDVIVASDLDVINGGAGTNSVRFAAGVSATNLEDGDLNGITQIVITNTKAAVYDFSVQAGEAFNILGGASNDAIVTATGTIDTISAGAGNDVLVAEDTDALIDGGVGSDTVRFASVVSAANLTDKDLASVEYVVITNTGNGDYDFSVQTESLQITGNAGNDTIYGGYRADTITGGAGVDYLYGNGGADLLVADDDDVLIDGGVGDDTVRFAAAVTTSHAAGWLVGIENVVISSTGNGRYDFSAQVEALNISSNSGSDTLTGGLAADTLSGGAGDDLLVAQGTDALLDGGTGTDTVRFDTDVTTALTDVRLVNVERVEITDTGTGTYDFGLQTEALIIVGNAGADTITGGSGNDSISGEGGTDSLSGGAGSDTLVGSTGNDTLSGGEGVDSLSGGDGDDILVAQDIDAKIDGGPNGDVHAGYGDTVRFAAGVTALNLTDAKLVEIERVEITNSSVASYDFSAQTEALIIRGGGVADNIIGTLGWDDVDGGIGNDTLTGGVGSDLLQVSAGSDIIADLVTGDVLIVSAGATATAIDVAAFVASAATDNDGTAIINAAAAGSLIDLSLETGSVGYMVNGGAGVDVVTGSVHDDTLAGGAGADSLVGGDGANVYRYGAEEFVVAETLTGGAGSDTVVFTADSQTVADGDFANKTLLEAITLGNGGNSLTLGAVAAGATAGLMVTGGTGADTIDASVLGEALTVNAGDGNNLVTGSSAADTLTAGSGNDTLTGGAGADSLVGGEGANVYRYGAGEFVAAETLTGGAGSDTVVFTADSQTVADGDFANKTLLEAITLGNGVNSLTLGAVAAGATAGLTVTGGTGADTIDASVLGEALTVNAGDGDNLVTGSSAADTLTAGSGNDTLTGGAGADSLVGGEGSDTFVYDSAVADETGAGVETIAGGNGTDTIVVAGGTTGVNFSTDTISGVETLELSTSTDVQTVTMLDAQVDALSDINADGDQIVLADVMTSDMLDGTVVNGELTIQVKDLASNALTLVDGVMDAVADLLKVDASGLTGANALTFVGLAETTARVSVTGGAGNDVVKGTNTALVDTLVGGAGNDEITGGAGADSLVGGEGDDVFRFASGAELNDDATVIGGNGTDTIEITGADTGLVDADFDHVSGVEVLTLTGASAAVLATYASAAGIGSVNTGAANTALTSTMSTVLSVDAEALADGQLLTLSGTGNVTVGNLLADLTSTSTGTVAVTLDDDAASGMNATITNNASSGTLTVNSGEFDGDDTITLAGTRAMAVVATDSVAITTGAANASVSEVTSQTATINATAMADGGTLTLSGAGGFTVTGLQADLSSSADGGALSVTTADVATQTIALGSGITGTRTVNATAMTDGDALMLTGSDALTLSSDDADVNAASYTGAITATVTNAADATLQIGTANATVTAAGNDAAKTLTIDAAANTANTLTIADAGVKAGDITVSNAKSTVTLADAFTGTGDVTVVTADDAAVAINFGTSTTGTRTVNATALTDGQVLTLTGSDDASVTLVGGDLAAGSYVGKLTVTATTGTNAITTGSGNDTLTGGAGVDSLNGGSGDDVFLIAAAGDYTTDTVLGGAGADVIRFTSTTGAETLTLNSSLADSDNTIAVVIGDAAGVSTGTTALNVTAAAVTLSGGVSITGNAGTNLLTGSDYADTITGGAGADTITGGAGIDNLSGGIDANVYRYGAGEFVAAETLTGGAGSDTVVFTADSQTVADGDFANKTLLEAITLGNGVNSLTLGATAAGATAGLTVTGGTGADTIDASALGEAVTANAGDGDNLVTGSSAADTLTAGSGNDTLTGGAGADSLLGGNGANVYRYGAWEFVAAETLTGGAGSDTVVFTADSQTVADGDFANKTLLEAITLGNGVNSLTLGTTAAGATVGLTVTGGTGADTIDASALGEAVTINAGNGNNVVTGSSAADTLTAGSGDDTLTGGAGTDSLDGGAGSDTFRFASGAELNDDATVIGGSESDTIEITAAATDIDDTDFTDVALVETLALTGASTAVLGTEASAGGLTTVDTGTGATSITATVLTALTVKSDVADGSLLTLAGDDVNFTVTGLVGDLTVDNTHSGDVAVTLGSVANTTVALGTNTTGTHSVNADALTDGQVLTLTGSDDASVTLVGGDLAAGSYVGKLTVNAGSGSNVITTGNGNDTITGGAGNDVFNANGDTMTVTDLTTGDALAVGASGTAVANSVSAFVATSATVNNGTDAGKATLNAAVAGSTIDVSLAGDAKGFNLVGNTGMDIFTGTTNADSLSGAGGADVITGNGGADSIDGGTNNDILVFASVANLAAAATVIGGDAIDTVRIDSGTSAFTATDADFAHVSTVETLALNGTGLQTLTLGTEASEAFGVGLTITTQATATGLVLDGAAMTRSMDVTGTNNADTLTGGSQNDALKGGSGADVITGSAGSDNLQGGTGTDIFVYGAASELGAAEAIDGGADVDTIRLDAGGTYDFTTVTTSVSNVEQVSINANAAMTIKLNDNFNNDNGNVEVINGTGSAITAGLTIDASAFTGGTAALKVSATNFAGNDTFIGTANADTITGGAGADTLTGGNGVDSLDGGAGDDVFRFASGAELNADATVIGGSESDTIEITAAATDIDDTDFTDVDSVQTLALTGASTAVLGTEASAGGLTTVDTGTGATSITATVLAALTVKSDVADGSLLTLAGDTVDFTVTGLVGDLTVSDTHSGDVAVTLGSVADITVAFGTNTTGTHSVNADVLTDGQVLTLTGSDDASVTLVGGDLAAGSYVGKLTVTATTGTNSITTGSGNDTITGDTGNDTITGGAGADEIFLGSADTAADVVRAAEGDGVVLNATGGSEPAHADVDRVYDFAAANDKFAVIGASSSVILNGAAASQVADTTFTAVNQNAFDLNGTIAGAFINDSSAVNLRDYVAVGSAIGAIANESVGEEAYFVVTEALNYGVYHFVSNDSNNAVGAGELELIGLLIGTSGSITAANFVFY